MSIHPSEMTLHPVAQLFPEMSESEFEGFLAHFREHGQQEPVVADGENRIIDGRHRWRAALACDTKLQVQYAFRLGLDTEEKIFQFALAKNLHRRHLSESQRAMIAAELSGPARKGRRKKNGANLQISVDEAAESLQVSPRSVSDARKVVEKGAPSLVAAVKQGTVAVSTAAKAVDALSGEEQEKVLQAAEPGKAVRDAVGAKGLPTEGHGKARKEEEGESAPGEKAYPTVRELTRAELDLLDANGYEPHENPYCPPEERIFKKSFKKSKGRPKRETGIDFCWVDGVDPDRRGERFIASYVVPGMGVGCGGGTIGFYLTAEDAVEACEHWAETGEFLRDADRAVEEGATTEGHVTARLDGVGRFLFDVEGEDLTIDMARDWMDVRARLIDGLFDLLYGGTRQDLLNVAQRAAGLSVAVQEGMERDFQEGIAAGEDATTEYILGWFETRLDEIEARAGEVDLPTEGHGKARKGQEEGDGPSAVDVALLEALGFLPDEEQTLPEKELFVWRCVDRELVAVFEEGSWVVETNRLGGDGGPKYWGAGPDLLYLLKDAGCFELVHPIPVGVRARLHPSGDYVIYDSLPAKIHGTTKGSPFHGYKVPDRFDFAALCRGLEVMRWAGTTEALTNFGEPTQDQVDYLNDILPLVVPWLADVLEAFTACTGGQESESTGEVSAAV